MKIQDGLVPQWMADLLNGRKDDAPAEHGVSSAESGSATAASKIPVSTQKKDRTMQMSLSTAGRHSSIGTNPKGAHGGRPRRSFPRAQARKLRKQGLSIRAIGARMGVPASTVADALKIINLTETK